MGVLLGYISPTCKVVDSSCLDLSKVTGWKVRVLKNSTEDYCTPCETVRSWSVCEKDKRSGVDSKKRPKYTKLPWKRTKIILQTQVIEFSSGYINTSGRGQFPSIQGLSMFIPFWTKFAGKPRCRFAPTKCCQSISQESSKLWFLTNFGWDKNLQQLIWKTSHSEMLFIHYHLQSKWQRNYIYLYTPHQKHPEKTNQI